MSTPGSVLLEPPSRVVSATRGAERNADSGVFTLANGPSSDPAARATIVLDYGRCVGGIPTFLVDRAQGGGPIDIKVVYSETADGIHSETGDGPFFFFSNAMDCYRCVSVTIPPSASPQTIRAALAQRSQRYVKLVLLSAISSVVFSRIGMEPVRQPLTPTASFHCSNETLNRIWRDGVNTLDMCTVAKGETAPSWDVTDKGTRVLGQHWAPCRQGTRWGDKEVAFEVLVERRGASWGVHMVANGVIFCLDTEAKELRAYEGLAHTSAVFPVKSLGSWSTHGIVKELEKEDDDDNWIRVSTITSGNRITVKINGREVATIADVQVRPLLGGSGINTGSVAFGGPEGWLSLYRNLVVRDAGGGVLYENDLLSGNRDRTLADFQVGTNTVACMIDGAKRDRATFGGDLFVSGRGVAYSGLDLGAVAGSIDLLASHQTHDGYLGNLCPIQAPLHSGDGAPPTYAFYSMTYALLLVVAIKDYWLHSGDDDVLRRHLSAAEKLLRFAESHVKSSGLIEVPPDMSMHWLPLGGPVFGASGTTNLAYYDALAAVKTMSPDGYYKMQLSAKMEALKKSIVAQLWNSDKGSLRMGTALPHDGFCQDTNGYAVTLKVAENPDTCLTHLTCAPGEMPPAFKGLQHWDRAGVVSPYATGFAVEALFARHWGRDAIQLIESVWGPMADSSGPDYSGGHWEAMTAEGKPFGHDTSLMHAWSTWPVFLLPQYVVGVRPLVPGWRRVQVAPVLSGIESARYRTQTPQGRLEVEVRSNEAAGVMYVTVTVPDGVRADIVTPPGYTIRGSGVVEGPCKKLVVELFRL
ncbi:Putative six-hairpin glycosidase superfamily, alpha-L-rhamnosidase domain-containing protein [Colletotrichum destructivum]|uniref:Six-hairpin glycosidase superfamily, alpha-L-rhamnosidase domain-containing protein n=1 Tax=Colletotrichum destructivum TaxID=34406 RepID=A0AAX4J1A3_9PEZI|nr:Putative six-hairpin glycosidase superfamily, alpha-L-rhamnosidase domain-containing protein [Colletotrichum destructivum]